MKKETRLDFARRLINSELFDLKATLNGLHLVVLGRLNDGRYFAARFDGKAPIDNGDKDFAGSLIGVEVSYCRSRNEAEWFDDYYYHRACTGYDRLEGVAS